MTVRRVSPLDAQKLIEEEGYVYVDVRSVPEFQAGHPAGAYNVPLVHAGPHGMSPNPDFVSAMQRTFPPDSRLVLGCQAGGRSLRAAYMLEEAGYTQVVDQRAGFDGGGPERGWRASGLPVAKAAEPGRAWDDVSAAKP
jgi:rhodanese-related sulfurtransferase